MQALGIQNRQMDAQSMADAALTVDVTSKHIPQTIMSGPRVGINQQGANADAKLRFFVARNPYVSKMRKRDADLENHGWRD